MNRRGVRLTEPGVVSRVPVRATADPVVVPAADLVLLCVKSHDAAAALVRTSLFCTESSLLISFQNGIRHLELLDRMPGPGYCALGITAMGAAGTGPGEVAFGGAGITRLGFLSPPEPKGATLLAAAAADFVAGGMVTTVEADIIKHVWAKLLVNVGINALTALYNCPNGRLLEIPEARQQLVAAVREAEAVARAKGIMLPGEGVARTQEVCHATAVNISSMLQDVRHARPTEIDAINGAVVEEGRRLGVLTPVNAELVRRVKGLGK